MALVVSKIVIMLRSWCYGLRTKAGVRLRMRYRSGFDVSDTSVDSAGLFVVLVRIGNVIFGNHFVAGRL